MTLSKICSQARSKVQEYIDGVIDEEIPAGRLQRLAVERHVRDLFDGQERGLWFDEEVARRAVRFFEEGLYHSKGEWAGKPFILEGWEAFIIWSLFGWMRGDYRRFNIAYVEVARKNGKSSLAAGVGLLLTISDREPGAEVFSAATKKDQARIVHNEAIRMVKRSPKLKKLGAQSNKNVIAVPAIDSSYVPLSADKDTMDGLNVHGAIVDELHAHKKRDVWDVLVTAIGSRRQPLIFAITTAGYNRESVCWEQHDYSAKVLEGLLQDDSHFAFIATIDEGDNWLDEDVWLKANPNLGVSVSIDDMRRQAEKARQTPAYENNFRRLKLCQWTQQAERWLNMDDWAASAFGGLSVEADFRQLEKSVAGKTAYCGLDLASTTDIAALVLVVPVDEDFVVLPYFWTPEDKVTERIRDKVPYKWWVDHGYMFATPGNIIDYAFIRQKVKELGETYRIDEIGYDPWNSSKLITELTEDGFQMIPVRQGYASMSPPTKELLTQVLGRHMIHGNHPVLKWMAGNLAVVMDDAGNVKPSRPSSTDKIDGMVALIMGLDRAIRHEGEAESIYETERLTVL
jgi:phage terminase large subunit-like protein